MEYEVHLVHAPSASGKTTFLNTGTSSELCIDRKTGKHAIPDLIHRFGDAGLVDGDELIHHTIGWPGDKAWFKKAGATYVHFAQLASLLNTAMRLVAPSWMNHLVIMFNGGMKKIAIAEKLYMVDREDGSLVKLHHHCVIPSREDHERNIESRRQENLKEGRSWTFPENWGDAHNNRESVQKIAELFGVTVRETFDEVMSDITSAEKTSSSTAEEKETEYSGAVEEWEFAWASRGYKDNDPPDGGSTRIVWKHPSDYYLVMKLFDSGDLEFPEEPRTVKFWKTSDFRTDRMKWASAANQFDPTDEELAAYMNILKDLWDSIPHGEVPKIYGQ